MQKKLLNGLIAATCTPLDKSGELHLEVVPSMVDHLIGGGVRGLYVCGSTGEGMSLSCNERIALTQAFVEAVAGRLPVISQVGHNSLQEGRRLAREAQRVGVDAISATCPSYFKISDVETLTECMAEIAGAAPELPFYYYHIPMLTGSAIYMPEFLLHASSCIPNLVGIKYTDTKLHEFQECLELDNRRFEAVWGCDEMLLGALAVGADAAIGSTYNVMSSLYRQLIDAFQKGDIDQARRLQSQSVAAIQVMGKYQFQSALKAVVGMFGCDVGGCRLPLKNLTKEEVINLRADLEAIGFFDWAQLEAFPTVC